MSTSVSPTMSPTVGYYVHHVGSGHRHRAAAVASVLERRGVRVAGLSSGPRPDGWRGEWVELPRDDDPAPRDDADPTAGGRLHWAPLHHPGLADRNARIAAWIARTRPAALVSDVSQEVTLLARLHGVPVVSVLLPGRRDDAAHTLGLQVSTAVVALWPSSARGMAIGLPDDVAARLQPLGGLSRYAPVAVRPRCDGPSRLVVLAGSGGGAEVLAAHADDARRALPHWRVRVLGTGTWVDDPSAVVREADVVLTHAGQNALAETAAARVPAIVVPQPRPHDEQATTGAVLGSSAWPALVLDGTAAVEWARLAPAAAALDGGRWSAWVDGRAAERFADAVAGVAGITTDRAVAS